MQSSLRIRRGLPQDTEIIAQYNSALALETEGKILDQTKLLRGVKAVLSDPDKGRYYVAETLAGEVVGQLMITYEWSDWRDGSIWWIQSVYVAPGYRSQGVFRSLFEHVWEDARSTPGTVGIRLYVEEKNEAAQRVYGRLGMEPGGYHVLEKWIGDAQPGRVAE